MNIDKIVNRIKELVEMGKGVAAKEKNVYAHVQLFAVLDLRLEETNRLLTEINRKLPEPTVVEVVDLGPG